MARAARSSGVADSSARGPADFYRQEFLRHRECLARQREYFSEGAITNAERALLRVIGELDRICAKDDADELISQLLRKFNAVTGLSGWSDPSKLH
jgi:hypothetical protein